MTTRTEAVLGQLPAGGHILCAVSGGRDSMCLLHYLMERGDLSVTAAHFDHHLRPTSGRDAAFVRDWCRTHGIPFLLGEGDVAALAAEEGLSTEEAARKARYAFLERAAREGGFAAVCTAHHARDNAETILLNLIRGTGSAGSGGCGRPGPWGRARTPRCCCGPSCAGGRRSWPATPKTMPSPTWRMRATGATVPPGTASATRSCRCWRASIPRRWATSSGQRRPSAGKTRP